MLLAVVRLLIWSKHKDYHVYVSPFCHVICAGNLSHWGLPPRRARLRDQLWSNALEKIGVVTRGISRASKLFATCEQGFIFVRVIKVLQLTDRTRHFHYTCIITSREAQLSSAYIYICNVAGSERSWVLPKPTHTIQEPFILFETDVPVNWTLRHTRILR